MTSVIQDKWKKNLKNINKIGSVRGRSLSTFKSIAKKKRKRKDLGPVMNTQMPHYL